jgi:galactoside O-acetyltransferase
MGWLASSELSNFKSVGENVLISEKCSIIGSQHISIGSNVRIDDFSTLIAASGFIEIGSNIHIGGYCYLGASHGIIMKDFSGISQGVRIYSASDDYSGEYLTGPTIPRFANVNGEMIELTSGKKGIVTLEKHVIIGSNSVVLPSVTVKEGAAIGAMSLVTKSCLPWSIYAGAPVKKLGPRSQKLLELEEIYKESL